MSAATLFAAFALTGDGIERVVRRFLFAFTAAAQVPDSGDMDELA